MTVTTIDMLDAYQSEFLEYDPFAVYSTPTRPTVLKIRAKKPKRFGRANQSRKSRSVPSLSRVYVDHPRYQANDVMTDILISRVKRIETCVSVPLPPVRRGPPSYKPKRSSPLCQPDPTDISEIDLLWELLLDTASKDLAKELEDWVEWAVRQ
ncbi:hypothetical protein PM082_011763 [Marasmius tenuissimus]|nr:hypothetical protein PM082_011763 [Marasmius tenuissimus]